MIRIGSLFALNELDDKHFDSRTGMTPAQQLDAIYKYMPPLYQKKNDIYHRLKGELKQNGIYPLTYAELNVQDIKLVKNIYKVDIKPFLSPQIVGPHHPFPHLLSKELYIAALLKRKNNVILGLLTIPTTLSRLIHLSEDTLRYIRLEHVLSELAADVFGNYEILEKTCICITRNADLNPEDDAIEEFDDFRSQMKKLLRKRRNLSVVRLESSLPISEQFSELLCSRLQIEPHQILISDAPLNMNYVFDLADNLTPLQKDVLLYPDFTPQPAVDLDMNQSLLRQVKQKDVLLCYPYESIDAFLQLIKEAGANKNVISIKITIYRLAKRAKLVDYLCAGAENGKEVTVVMELRARFDERNNIDWSKKLEEAGCKVIYGFPELKVHSKVCLITLKDKNGVSYITQIGTGNYNEKTANLYTDISLITAAPEIGRDAANLFQNLMIESIEGEYNALLVAPTSLKQTLLNLIEEEIAKKQNGFIFFKMNSLTDIDFIEKLTKASLVGVRVQLIVRGICCLLPNVPGKIDNITVISIVGRFLEHSRVYCFGQGEAQQIYISSADLMTRNTERRIEVACPILDSKLKKRILDILEVLWYDNVKARILCADSSYIKKEDKRLPLDAQMYCPELFRKAEIEDIVQKSALWRKVLNCINLNKE